MKDTHPVLFSNGIVRMNHDPTKVQPLNMENKNNIKIVTAKLIEFDQQLVAMNHMLFVNDHLKSDPRSLSMSYSMCDLSRDHIIQNVNFLLTDFIWTSKWHEQFEFVHDSIRDNIALSSCALLKKSAWASELFSVFDVLTKSGLESINNSMMDSAWSSLCGNLSKKEYESLFTNKEIIERLPYKNVSQLCKLYNWFTENGFFPYRSLKKGDYLLVPWINPEYIETITIS